MSEFKESGTGRRTFFTGNDDILLKHIKPPAHDGPAIDPLTPDRAFHLSLMSRIRIPLPNNVANMVGEDELPMWVIRNRDLDDNDRTYPSSLLRIVQGEVVHALVESSTDTHTIHWHGIEPTPVNDGVGKHSFEINGEFTYQFQPNEAGTYFYHCHKNTTLHFEMGLFGGLIVDPPAPEGSGLTAPYVTGGPGFVAGKRSADDDSDLIRYDIEKIWVVDDMDSRWHEPEPHHNHNMQEIDPLDPAGPDTFHVYGSLGEFELNDFRQNIFAVSGVLMNEASGPPFIGSINAPAVRIDAVAGQTVLLRYLNASYTIQELTLPVDALVIAWDGHPLGVGGFHRFSRPYVVPAGTPIRTTSARRCDIIISPTQAITGTAHIRYYNWVGGVPDGLVGHVQIPVTIGSPEPATGVEITPSHPSPHLAGTAVVFTAQGQGSTNYDYRFWLYDGTSWSMVQDYGNGNAWTLPADKPAGSYTVAVDVRTSSGVDRDAVGYLPYALTATGPATGVVITPSQPTPHIAGTAVVFTAEGQGSTNYDYRFLLFDGTSWTQVQDYGNGNSWTMDADTDAGRYVVAVDVRTDPSVNRDAVAYLPYEVYAGPATGVVITPSRPTPHPAGSPVVFTAEGQGSANYDYRFWVFNGTSWTQVQDYGNGNSWTMLGTTPLGAYVVAVDVRTSSTVYRDAVGYFSYEITPPPAAGVVLIPDVPSPQPQGTPVVFTAAGQGSFNYDYRFWLFDGSVWTMVQDYGGGNVWTMDGSTPAGSYVIAVDVRTSLSVYRDTVVYVSYQID